MSGDGVWRRRSVLLGACLLLAVGLTGCEVRVGDCDLWPYSAYGRTFSDSGMRVANCPGGDLRGGDLSDMLLADSNFVGADLSGADLSDTSLVIVNFTDATLDGANLDRVMMLGGLLSGASLRDASLRGASFTEIGSANVDLTGADLSDAQFVAVWFDGADVSGSTLLPSPAPVVAAPGASSATVTWSTPAPAGDAALGACDRASGSTFPIGITTVTCTVNGIGTNVSGTFEVTVVPSS